MVSTRVHCSCSCYFTLSRQAEEIQNLICNLTDSDNGTLWWGVALVAQCHWLTSSHIAYRKETTEHQNTSVIFTQNLQRSKKVLEAHAYSCQWWRKRTFLIVILVSKSWDTLVPCFLNLIVLILCSCFILQPAGILASPCFIEALVSFFRTSHIGFSRGVSIYFFVSFACSHCALGCNSVGLWWHKTCILVLVMVTFCMFIHLSVR